MTGLGVGLLGAGAASQAIHLPAIAALGGRLQVVHVMDPDEHVGQRVADRVGASYSADAAALLADPRVEVVAVCSPDWTHADLVEAACAAGKKAVLCEKPLAKSMEDAERIVRASEAAGVPVVVGAMQRYDPAFLMGLAEWGDRSEEYFIRSAIWLPDNNEMTALATDQVGHTVTPGNEPAEVTHERARAEALRDSILGLAVHNLPLIRLFAPEVERVTQASWVDPYGYTVTSHCQGTAVRMSALMPGRWAPSWTFEVTSPTRHLSVEFPPSYVLAGSSTTTLVGSSGGQVWRFPESGYENQWRHVADLAEQRVAAHVTVHEAVADLVYALGMADSAARAFLGGSR